MKNKNHYHPVDFDASVLSMSSFKKTCDAIYYSGYLPNVLDAWGEELLHAAQKDDRKGFVQLAHLGREVAYLINNSTTVGYTHKMQHIAEIGKNIARLRYDVMLKVSYHLRLGSEIQSRIHHMLALSIPYMHHEFQKTPLKVDVTGWELSTH